MYKDVICVFSNIKGRTVEFLYTIKVKLVSIQVIILGCYDNPHDNHKVWLSWVYTKGYEKGIKMCQYKKNQQNTKEGSNGWNEGQKNNTHRRQVAK